MFCRRVLCVLAYQPTRQIGSYGRLDFRLSGTVALRDVETRGAEPVLLVGQMTVASSLNAVATRCNGLASTPSS